MRTDAGVFIAGVFFMGGFLGLVQRAYSFL